MTQTYSPALEKACRFGDWHFDPNDGQLVSSTKRVRLQPRLSKLLSIFLANTNVLLGRQQLIEILWPNKAINEDALSRCVAELRSSLGDDTSSPQYIETVPKKGYRFIQSLNQPLTHSSVIKKHKPLLIASSIALVVIAIALMTIDLPLNTAPADNMSTGIKNALVNAQRVTADNLFEHQPSLSHDGQKIAFSVALNQQLKIRVINVHGDIIHQFYDEDYHLMSPVFSHDDSALVVAAVKRKECKILIYQLPSLQRQNLGDCYAPGLSVLFDWSPSGETIAYVGQNKISAPANQTSKASQENNTGAQGNTHNAAIWTYHIPTKQHIQRTQPTALNAFDSNPKFSPNGQHLAFTRGTNSYRKIYQIDFNELSAPPLLSTLEPAENLTNAQGYITGFDWLNNNRYLVFDSNALGDRNLWLFDLEQRQGYIVGGRDAQLPSIDKSNRRLIYQEIRYNANIWRLSLGALEEEPEPLIESIKYNNFPAYSPDGGQVAFVSNRQGKSAIWLYDLITKKQSKLVSVPQRDMILPSWSSDGKRMLVSSRGTEGYRCYQVDMQSETHQLLSGFEQPQYACKYADDGSIFAVSKVPGKTSQLLRQKTSGQISQLTQSGVGRFKISSLNTIVFTLPNEDGIYTMDLEGKNKHTLLADFSRSFDNHWTVKDNFLYYPVSKISNSKDSQQHSDNGIWQLNLNTLVSRQVTKILPSAIGLTISVDPTHSEILISRTDSRQADIYMGSIESLLPKPETNN